MAFFDSPKNKALWDKELLSLDAERERRKEEGYRPGPERMAAAESPGAAGRSFSRDNPKVRRITLKELEEIERRSREAAKEAGAVMDTPRRQKQGALRDRDIPERKTTAVGMQ